MENKSVCPWYMGWVLTLPLRKRFQNPEEILQPYVKPGMKVADYGCAMGFFTTPMARMVGKTGTVYGIDIQYKMIRGLERRAKKAQLHNIIKPLHITDNTEIPDLKEKIDFALLFAVVHEVPNQSQVFQSVQAMLKPGGSILFAEPSGHVSQEAFENSVEAAVGCGLKLKHDVTIRGSHAAVLFK